MGAPGPSIANGLRGRANRKEYWLFVAILFAVGMAMSYVVPAASTVGSGVVAYAQIRRLHDVGRSGWWVAAILAAQIALTVGLYLAFGSEDAMYVAAAVLTLIPIIWIGALPGTPGENRFGPAPGTQPLKDVFG